MTERYWYVAAEGKQQGPYPDEQFRSFIARGRVRGDMLVWCEGMADWLKASDIPNLFVSASAPPPVPVMGKRSKLAAGMLALFLGGIGIHKFYLGRPLQGILYLIFCWTLIPALIAFIEGIIYLSMSGDRFDRVYNSKP